MRPTIATLLTALLFDATCTAFSGTFPIRAQTLPSSPLLMRLSSSLSSSEEEDHHHDDAQQSVSRRRVLEQLLLSTTAAAIMTASTPQESQAATADAAVTDKIFVEIKTPTGEPQRIVIGLFGSEAPQATKQLKQLVSASGLPVGCKPLEQRTLQKEQLEANKVYNSCKETEANGSGVNYEYATVWRIVKDERIDFGAVSGKYISRVYPNWSDNNSLRHDAAGTVSVQKGDTAGFGFTVYPGNGGENASYLNENHVVVGRVLEGMDVIEKINQIPVVTSSKVNYMGLTGGPAVKSAPSRGCFYGGPMYCNENKPLQKLSFTKTGVVL